MPSSEYNVNINITTKDKTSGPAKQAAKGLDGVVKAAKAMAAGFAAIKVARVVAELTKLGAESQRQATALDNLARAAGTSGDAIVKSIREASNYTIDRMTAMQSANRAMIMDVAQSPAQFERLTTVAVALGRAMGQDAAKSIDDFVTAAGRQSRLIADNLGLIVDAETAYERYAKTLGKTSDQLTDAEKKQAFLNEMLVQGEAKLNALGDAALDNAGKIEQASSTWKTLKSLIGEEFADATLGATNGLGGLNQAMDKNEGLLRALLQAGIQVAMGNNNLLDSILGVKAAVQASSVANREWQQDEEEVRKAAEAVGHTLEFQSTKWGATDQATLDYLESLNETTDGVTAFMNTGGQLVELLQEQRQAAMDANAAFVDLAMQYTSYQADVTDAAQDFTARREEIEVDHQAKLEELEEKGSAKRVYVNEAAEKEKLQDLRDKLALAEMRYSEYGENVAASTKLAKEMQIADLKDQIAQQEAMLDDHYADRLWMKGKNVDEELAEEERHYQESLAELEAAQAEQEEAQKQSLGRMVLNHFEAWQEMNLAVDGYTADEAQFVQDMRLKIAREYGLMTDAAVAEINEQESEWNAMWSLAKQGALDTASALDVVIAKLNAMPTEKRIRITYELSQPNIPGSTLGGIPKQHGGSVRAGQMYLVGEAGRELFVPGSSGTIINNSRTEQMIGSHNTYNINDPRGMAFLGAAERAAARNAFARASGMGA